MIEQLRRFRFAEPFQPYVVRLRDGRVIPVFRPLALGWSEEGGQGSGFMPDDSIVIFRLDDVVSVRSFQEAVAS